MARVHAAHDHDRAATLDRLEDGALSGGGSAAAEYGRSVPITDIEGLHQPRVRDVLCEHSWSAERPPVTAPGTQAFVDPLGAAETIYTLAIGHKESASG